MDGDAVVCVRASERTGCKIYGKAEYENPGGSVKDRIAKDMIEKAEANGKSNGEQSAIIDLTLEVVEKGWANCSNAC
mgnify:CR=1 FL=1